MGAPVGAKNPNPSAVPVEYVGLLRLKMIVEPDLIEQH